MTAATSKRQTHLSVKPLEQFSQEIQSTRYICVVGWGKGSSLCRNSEETQTGSPQPCRSVAVVWGTWGSSQF